MQFAMISYKEAIHMCNVCNTVLKKPFKCEFCEQNFEKKTHFLQFLVKGLKKALNVYFVIKI